MSECGADESIEETIDGLVKEISEGHAKILEDFGKAYLAATGLEGEALRFILSNSLFEIVESDCVLGETRDGLKLHRKYWFRTRSPSELWEDGGGWVDTKDRLPEEGVEVLVCFRSYFFAVACVHPKRGVWLSLEGVEIAAPDFWMPIPEPPDGD